jgi:hypothetical protein
MDQIIVLQLLSVVFLIGIGAMFISVSAENFFWLSD